MWASSWELECCRWIIMLRDCAAVWGCVTRPLCPSWCVGWTSVRLLVGAAPLGKRTKRALLLVSVTRRFGGERGGFPVACLSCVLSVGSRCDMRHVRGRDWTRFPSGVVMERFTCSCSVVEIAWLAVRDGWGMPRPFWKAGRETVFPLDLRLRPSLFILPSVSSKIPLRAAYRICFLPSERAFVAPSQTLFVM